MTVLQIKEQTVGVLGRSQAEDIDMRSLEAMNTVAARIQRMDLMDRVASRQDVRASGRPRTGAGGMDA